MAKKSFCLVLSIMILFMISQLGSVVECRALKKSTPSTDNRIAAECDQPGEGANSMSVTRFGVAVANNDSTNGSDGGSAIRSLMFKLASGPSKRGPGH